MAAPDAEPGVCDKNVRHRGVDEHAHGFKTLAEALYLRERILGQLELAAIAPNGSTREAHGSFVVVGGGFTGLALASNGLRLARTALLQHPGMDPKVVRWTVVEAGPSVLGEFPQRLAAKARARLHELGVDARVSAAVAGVTADQVKLENGNTVPTRTVIWTAGVAPSPLISQLGLGTDHGRLVVDDRLQSREHEHIFALGDAAAVPDLTHPGKLAAQTAQNAQRQGLVAARNVAASLGHGKARRSEHHNLGFVVDLTGRNAVATPLGLPLTGWAAKLVDRLYHLRVLPSGRMRVLTDWINGLVAGRPIVRLELIDPADATINAEAHDPASTPRLDGLQRGGSRTQDEPASPAELGRGDHPQLHDLHRSSMAVTPHRQTAGEFSANE